MTLHWGDDPAHTIAARDNPPYPDARRDIAPVQWQRLAARYGSLPTLPPRAGERGFDWESRAPDERWRGVLSYVVIGVGCVGCGYLALLVIPIVGEWIRGVFA